MEKISKVITTCHDCEHCRTLYSKENNYSKAYVCNFTPESEQLIHNNFLLVYTEYSGSPALEIPNECPLEDYKSNKKANE